MIHPNPGICARSSSYRKLQLWSRELCTMQENMPNAHYHYIYRCIPYVFLRDSFPKNVVRHVHKRCSDAGSVSEKSADFHRRYDDFRPAKWLPAVFHGPWTGQTISVFRFVPQSYSVDSAGIASSDCHRKCSIHLSGRTNQRCSFCNLLFQRIFIYCEKIIEIKNGSAPFALLCERGLTLASFY